MPKQQNLLLVTEHYPCGFQEAFLEAEIEYLTRLYNVHVITTDTDRLMTRPLPRGVTFSRPAEHSGRLKRGLARIQCLLSRGYAEERRWAKKEGRWSREFARHTLDALVESRLIYNYVRGLDIFQDERPLTIYSANMNNGLYGLCCLKEFSESGIRVVARCHRANMMDPVTGKRRDTLNHIIHESVDALYFTSPGRRETYYREFCRGESKEVRKRLRVAPLGVPAPLKKRTVAMDDYLLRIVSCSPIEKDKRLDLLIEGIAGMEAGCVEWVHIGDGSDRERILQLAREKLGEKPGIRYRFLGRMNQRELYRWYAETPVDVFFSVSRSESVPAAMLEAMANHIFVCATEVDGVTDVLDNKAALLMPENPAAGQLSRLLEALCGLNRELFREKSDLAFRRWEESFNAEVNCVNFVRELANMAGLPQEDFEPEPEPEEKSPEEPPVFSAFASSPIAHKAPGAFVPPRGEDPASVSEQKPAGESAPEEPGAPEKPDDSEASSSAEEAADAEDTSAGKTDASDILAALEQIPGGEPLFPEEPADRPQK